MVKLRNILNLRAFISDFIVIVFSLIILIMIVSILVIMLVGSRESGMSYGLIVGVILGFLTFYYFRGEFTFKFTVLQLIINVGLTYGEILCIFYLLSKTGSAENSYGYFFLIFSLPIFICINKQLIDNLTIKITTEKRIKQPIYFF